MKPKYRVLISTRGHLLFIEDSINCDSYLKWGALEGAKITTQANNQFGVRGTQVNYFIPISE